MPFDAAIPLALARRQLLIGALLGKMPDHFTFRFEILYTEHSDCSSAGCALGLASLIWPEHARILLSSEVADQARFFGLSEQDTNRIFWDEGPRDGSFYHSRSPRPKTVAMALERAPFYSSPETDRLSL